MEGALTERPRAPYVGAGRIRTLTGQARPDM